MNGTPKQISFCNEIITREASQFLHPNRLEPRGLKKRGVTAEHVAAAEKLVREYAETAGASRTIDALLGKYSNEDLFGVAVALAMGRRVSVIWGGQQIEGVAIDGKVDMFDVDEKMQPRDVLKLADVKKFIIR